MNIVIMDTRFTSVADRLYVFYRVSNSGARVIHMTALVIEQSEKIISMT